MSVPVHSQNTEQFDHTLKFQHLEDLVGVVEERHFTSVKQEHFSLF